MIIHKVVAALDVLASRLTFSNSFNIIEIVKKAKLKSAIVFSEILKKNISD